MEQRYSFIERIRRQIYGSQPNDDASISFNLVNRWLEDALASAAKQNYKDSMNLEQVAFVNNSFYTTFSGLSVTAATRFFWQIALPQIPIGIGSTMGISTIQFVDSMGNVSLPCIPLTQNQKAYFQQLRPIPGRILFYNEGNNVFALSTILLSAYTASVSMISGGDSTNMNSILNVPSDYFPMIVEYIKGQLAFERAHEQDTQNDGISLATTKE